MFKSFKRFLIGRPLKNEAAEGEKLGILWGLPILASDAVSSVAYAGQEILITLVPIIGVAAYGQLTILSAAIIGLLILLTLSYRQTIESYPNGGGAYIVAKENIGTLAGVAAGAALSIDYVMTVAVSISSGILAITTRYTFLSQYKVWMCVGVVLLLMIGNLRGVRESSKVFSIPAYAFMLALAVMIIIGIFNFFTHNYTPVVHSAPVLAASSPVVLFLLLKAFSNGCAALTGVEAVSNAVPSFKDPARKHAKIVLLLLAMLVLFLFGGSTILTNIYQVEPDKDHMVIIQIATLVFSHIPAMFYFMMITTFVILAMAANTAFTGFPMLVSVMAREGFFPRQLSMRGDRLSYSNGILLLSVASAIIIVIFKADVGALVGLYAIGVFIAFTLSQTGMFLKWFRERGKNWLPKAIINGFGAFVTSLVVVLVAITKFDKGSWMVVIAVPVMIFLMLKVKKHYVAVTLQLRLKPEELSSIDISHDVYKNRVIVPVESMNKSSVRALRYARTISENVVAFNVSIDEESGIKIRERYDLLKTDIPLIIKYSPFRKVVDPLLKFIESAEYDYQKGDMITVILPQFTVKNWWHNLLHNRTWKYIQRQLLKHKHIVVSTMPLQLKDDAYVMKNPKYK